MYDQCPEILNFLKKGAYFFDVSLKNLLLPMAYCISVYIQVVQAHTVCLVHAKV